MGELMGEVQRREREKHKQEGLQEALAVAAEDSPHWTPTEAYECPQCKSVNCLYLMTVKTMHAFDDNNWSEPALTVRCVDCKYLWREDETARDGEDETARESSEQSGTASRADA